MSYIRGLTNPEGLYIYAGASGHVEIVERDKPLLTLPIHVFHGVFRGLDVHSERTKRYRGAALARTNDFRWRLMYRAWERSVVLWDVTAKYLADDVAARHAVKKRHR